ncbi:hypothetical protein BT93_L2390 [Corymbia citriodora subsp. variegata]|uniref:Uncharacterized protein n=1 Tax=Corymbia citriodora subsp. variegata TaxID=360336 RepID=A0A8T0CK76_CORYI|nr:hypothetical protein BT93_L2390 [Corymbia citriodora subsp. variegata]
MRAKQGHGRLYKREGPLVGRGVFSAAANQRESETPEKERELEREGECVVSESSSEGKELEGETADSHSFSLKQLFFFISLITIQRNMLKRNKMSFFFFLFQSKNVARVFFFFVK